MSDKIRNFFSKHDIRPQDIKYIIRENQKTVIYLLNGRKITTYTTVKDIYASLRKTEFLSVNKGIIVAISHILRVDKGYYIMTDGASFKGRARTAGMHREISENLPNAAGNISNKPANLDQLNLHFLDKMPAGFCVIELSFQKEGNGVDLIFRYCNERMAEVEHVPINEMLNRSFYEVIKDGDQKWLAVYADVALNGINRVVRITRPKLDQDFVAYCFQPLYGYCACLIISKNKLLEFVKVTLRADGEPISEAQAEEPTFAADQLPFIC